VQDGFGKFITKSLSIFIAEKNEPPIVTAIQTDISFKDTILVGGTFNYQVNVTDPNSAEVFTYWLQDNPPAMIIDSLTGFISWTPAQSDLGSYTVTVFVRDKGGLQDSESFTLHILEQNVPPVLSAVPDDSVTAGEFYSYTLTATDANTDALLTFRLVSGPSTMSINTSTGFLTWIPSETEVGMHTVTVEVDDGRGGKDSKSFTLYVETAEDLTPPVITFGPVAEGIDTSTAYIRWETDEKTKGTVEYGLTETWSTTSAKLTAQSTDFKLEHVVQLSNLNSDASYTVRIMAEDENNNFSPWSQILEFKTKSRPDLEPPVIVGNPQILGADTNQITVYWETDEPSSSVVVYAEETLWGDVSARDTVRFADLVTFHYVQVTGLTPATTYKVVVASTDGKGNGPVTSNVFTFTTPDRPDYEAPIITKAPIAEGIDTSRATIIWETNEASNSFVQYARDELFDEEGARFEKKDETNYIRRHEIVLTGLEPGTTYRARVGSMDEKGNGPVWSAAITFTTLDRPDTEPPVILGFPEAVGIDTSRATIVWDTDEISNSIVIYAEEGLWDNADDRIEIKKDALVNFHQVLLTDLKSATLYNYMVGSIDGKGNGPTYSNVYEFTTMDKPDTEPPLITFGPQVEGVDTSQATILWETDEFSTSIVEYALESSWSTESLRKRVEDFNLVSMHSIVLVGLQPASRYIFRVGSVDEQGNGPSYSGEFIIETTDKPDTEPPIFTQFPSAEGIDTSRATIKWMTDEISNSIVEYALDSLYDTQSKRTIKVQPDLVTDHIVVLSGLKPGKKYRYRVGSVDSKNNGPTYSGTLDFTTNSKPDTKPPVVLGFPIIEGIDTSRATIKWTTDEISTSIVEYAKSSEWEVAANRRKIEKLALVKDHSIPITDLEPNTEYTFRVGSKDANNNGPTYSEEHYFKTLERPDLFPPLFISFPSVQGKDTTNVTIVWTTNEPSNSEIEYAIDSLWNTSSARKTKSDQTSVIDHKIILTGLRPNTKYRYVAKSTDMFNNGPSVTTEFTFKTLEKPDLEPPVLLGFPDVVDIDTASLTIKWETNEPSSGTVEYAVATEWPNNIKTAIDQMLLLNHAVYISGLLSNTTYKFRVSSIDGKNNGPRYSSVFEFTTAEAADIIPPGIVGFPQVASVDSSSAAIEWKTNEASNSIVEYAESVLWPAEKRTVIIQEIVTEHKVFLSDLKANTSYTFRVQSIDSKGNVSDYSIEQEFTTLALPDNTPPAIIGLPGVVDIDTNSAAIVWKTDENATSTVTYGPDSLWPSSQDIQEDLSLVVNHKIVLTGLIPDITYRFKVSSIDAKSNGPSESSEFTFRTLAKPDVRPPVIIGFPNATNIDTSKATIEWKTNEISNSIVEYAEESGWPGDKKIVKNQNLVDFHSIMITSLKPNTSYKFRVGSTDSKNNGPTYSIEMTFKTAEQADIIPPEIVGFPDIIGIDTNRVTVFWRTNENATSIIEYGVSSLWPEGKKKITLQDLVLEHSVLIPGLLPDTEYTFVVASMDAKNNGPAFSTEQTFRTLDVPDNNPPVIIGFPSVVNIDTNKATAEWKTDENATSIAEYAPSDTWPAGKKTITVQDLVIDHSILLPDLLPATDYTFRVGSVDEKSNGPAYSIEQTFSTLEAADLTPPAIIGFPNVFGIDTNKVTIEWKTNENATSIIEYELEEKWNGTRKTIVSQELVTSHTLMLTNLQPDTTYKFRVGSIDANNNGPTYGSEQTFRTEAVADNNPPSIVGLPSAIGIDMNKATIEWKTNESSTSIVEFAKESEWATKKKEIKNQSLVVEHSILVSNLIPSTTYKYRVGSMDGKGNGPVYSIEQTFTTLAAPDFNPPRIVGFPSSVGIDTNSATILWTTNEDATSIVEYALSSQWASNKKKIVDQNLVINHDILLANLLSDSAYTYRVGSIDGKNNGPTYSGEFTFTTLAVPDNNPPVIVGLPSTSKIDTCYAAIVWKTDENATSIVEYAQSSEWPNNKKTFTDQNLVIDHTVGIGNLPNDTEYTYRVGSMDRSGNGPVYSSTETFRTLKAADETPPAFSGFPSTRNVDTSSVTIEWETDEPANSIVEIGESGTWPTGKRTIKIQNLWIEHSVYISELEPNTEYTFKVGSMDGDGNGPSWSGTFTFTTLERPDLEAPTLIGFPLAVDIDTTSAKITWETDENSTSIVEFGSAVGWPANKKTATLQDLVINHSVFIKGLVPNTGYKVRVGSIDAKSNGPTYSAEFEFKTAETSDVIPPVIQGFPNVDEVDTNSAIITWMTNEDASSIVEFATEANYATSKTTVKDQRLSQPHKVFLSNLKPGITYKYRVGSVDAKSNGPTWSSDYNFTTLQAPDTKPPVITGLPSEFAIDTTSLTIKWKTDERSTSIVEIALTNEWTTNKRKVADQALVIDHGVFVSNLSPGKEYTYRVGSIDAKSNGPTYSQTSTFKTLAVPDTKAPVIVETPIVVGLSYNQATIKWKTNETAFSSVEYGTSSVLGKIVTETKGKTTHTIQLNNLIESTKYYFRIRSKDQKGNEFVGNVKDFTTKPKPVTVDVSPPTILEGPIDKDIKHDRATVKWRTDKTSSSVVEYGLDSTNLNFNKTQDASVGVNEHIVNVTNLDAGKTYFYRVRSRGANNKEVVSRKFKFTTDSAPDTLPATILTGPDASFIETDKVTIYWSTDKLSSSIVYYGKDTTPGNVAKFDMLQGVKEHKVNLTGLEAGTTYYYKVESQSENLKIVTSRQYTFKTKSNPDVAAPKITGGPYNIATEHDKVTIEWITDELSNSYIEYDTTDAFSQHEYSDKDASGVNVHTMTLTNLVTSKTYRYKVSSSDLSPNQNTVTSPVRTFTTLAAPDTIKPVMTRGPESSTTHQTATFEWETDELSDTRVYYKVKNSTDNYKKIADETKVTTHIITVTGLTPGVEYVFILASTDYAGNTFVWPETGVGEIKSGYNERQSVLKILGYLETMQPPGGDGSFFTSLTVDTQKPTIIDGPKILSKTTSTATIYWKTDERSDSYVDYGSSTDYGDIKGEPADVYEHKITLTNLSASQLYNFKVASTDANDNGPAESVNSVFTTESAADVTPPSITAGPEVESITDNQATVVWETDEPSDSKIEYGTTTNYGSSRASTDNVTVHRITLTNLTADTEYNFKVYSIDIDKNGPTSSDNVTFTTQAAPDRTPPVITNVTVSATTDKTATIEWDTDELSDSFIDYGFTSSYGYKTGSSQDVLHHKITVTNLVADSLYHFRVGSIDKSDNEAPAQPDATFRTAVAPDTIPPAIPAGLEAIPGSEKVLLKWNGNTEGDLAGYNIYRKINSTFTVIASSVTDTFYLDEGLTDGDTIEYKIKALDNVIPPNISEESSTVSVIPKLSNIPTVPEIYYPVAGVRVSATSAIMQVINAAKPAGREKLTYSFVVAEDSNFYQVVKFKEGVEEGGSGITSWQIGEELTNNKTYYWKARAFDGIFYGDWMQKSSFIADNTIATKIELAYFSAHDARGSVELEWETAVENNISGFYVYRSLKRDKDFTRINEDLITGERTYRLIDENVDVGKTYYYRIDAVNVFGFAELTETISVTVNPPGTFELMQNYPNPFNSSTTIKYELPVGAKVRLTIFNMLGQEVKTLVNEYQEAGFHKVMWDGRNNAGIPVSSGVYIYAVKAGNFFKTKKMVLLR